MNTLKFTLVIFTLSVIMALFTGCAELPANQDSEIEATMRKARIERLMQECEDCQREGNASCKIGEKYSCNIFNLVK